MTQISEKRLRESLNHMAEQHNDLLWFIKLQVNVMAHNPNPGDYLLHLPGELHCIEVKQVTRKQRISFSRLSQKQKLIEFRRESPLFQQGWVLMNFWYGSVKKSTTFMLTVEEYAQLEATWDKKSITALWLERRLPWSKLETCCGKYWKLGAQLHHLSTRPTVAPWQRSSPLPS